MFQTPDRFDCANAGAGPVSLGRMDTDVVVTEFGAADLRGRSHLERAEALGMSYREYTLEILERGRHLLQCYAIRRRWCPKSAISNSDKSAGNRRQPR